MSVTATPSKQVAESLSKIDVGASPTKAKGMKEVAKPAEETEEPVQSDLPDDIYTKFVGEVDLDESE